MTSLCSRRSALSFVYDRANLLTLAGLVCGILAIWFSARGAYVAASTALLWALFCDWFDGPMARRITDRTDEDRAFGAQLDSLTDMVSSGVAPAMLLISIGDFEPWFLPGAFLLVVAGAIRLAHFNILYVAVVTLAILNVAPFRMPCPSSSRNGKRAVTTMNIAVDRQAAVCATLVANALKLDAKVEA